MDGGTCSLNGILAKAGGNIGKRNLLHSRMRRVRSRGGYNRMGDYVPASCLVGPVWISCVFEVSICQESGRSCCSGSTGVVAAKEDRSRRSEASSIIIVDRGEVTTHGNRG